MLKSYVMHFMDHVYIISNDATQNAVHYTGWHTKNGKSHEMFGSTVSYTQNFTTNLKIAYFMFYFQLCLYPEC